MNAKLQRRTLLTAMAASLATPHIARAATGSLTIYDSLDFATPAAKAFQAKTGITVNVVEQGGTGGVLGKIAAEGTNPQFDIVWLEGSAVMERMAADGVLQKLPGIADKAPLTALGRKLVPANGAFTPTNVSTSMIAVNTKKIAAADLPKSWADLANPAFANAVACKDPNLSGPAYQWLAGLFQTVGVDKGKAMLLQILTNKALSGLPSGGLVNKALLTGNARAAMTQDSATFGKIAAGEPLAAIYPTEGVVALPSCIGVSSKTANLSLVRDFVAFVLSPAGQAAMLSGDDGDCFFVPIVEGIAAKPGRKTDIDFILLDNAMAAAHETEWKAWYREKFVP